MSRFSTSDEFDGAFKKLDRHQQELVLKKMEKVIANPELGKPLHKPMQHYLSERTEKLRIIYTTDEYGVSFIYLKHRKKAYGK